MGVLSWKSPPNILQPSASTVVRKLKKSIEQRGVLGTGIKFFVFPYHKFSHYVWTVSPAGRRQLTAEKEFDERHGVSTYQDNDPGWLGGIESSNWQFGTGYQPVPIERMTAALESLPIRYQDFTFIDFGSGKARSLFIAAHFPFKRAIGVEFCSRLHKIAKENVSNFQGPSDGCSDLEAIYGDATSFNIPDDPIVVFFNHPFDENVFKPMVASLVDTLKATPRKLYVIYFDPQCAACFPGEVFSEFKKKDRGSVIFEAS